MTILHFAFLTNAITDVLPEAGLVGVRGVTVGTCMSLDIVVHIHVVVVHLFGVEPLPTDAARVRHFLQVDSIGVLSQSTF